MSDLSQGAADTAEHGPASGAGAEDAADGRRAAFETLASLVRQWRSEQRKTYASGLKPGMQQAVPGFSEQELGFDTFHAFVAAAEDLGLVRMQRLASGQSVVLLPNEQPWPEPAAATTAPAAALAGSVAAPRPSAMQPGRLRPEVWSTFVDWHDAHERLWDRHEARCFAYPVDGDGRPAWLVEPARFVQVAPVAPDLQIRWMHEWAGSLSEPARGRLLSALTPEASRGQFKRELAALGAASAWRAELGRRVLAHVLEWARGNQVAPERLLDRRPDPAAPPSAPSSPPTAAAGSRAAAAASRRASVDGDDLARLRAVLHRVVDRMSLDELRALPVRAEHLLHL